MRLSRYTFVVLCSALICGFGLARPHAASAGDDRYAAYYQPADDEPDGDEAPSDEPEDPNEEMPAEELTDEEMPGEDAPAEMPSDDEPLERLPADEMPDERNPPTPATEDDRPANRVPWSRPARRPLPKATTTPEYDPAVPSQGYGMSSGSTVAKGWGYNGGCCANVWDGYCEEMRGCHPCGLGQGRLYCRIMCGYRGSSACSRLAGGRCRHQHGAGSCCGGSIETHEQRVVPPVPTEPGPYASMARSKRKNSAVMLQDWDMPRITSHSTTTRR